MALEVSLDEKTVRGICPICKILLVEAMSSSIADLGVAESGAAKLGGERNLVLLWRRPVLQ